MSLSIQPRSIIQGLVPLVDATGKMHYQLEILDDLRNPARVNLIPENQGGGKVIKIKCGFYKSKEGFECLLLFLLHQMCLKNEKAPKSIKKALNH